MRSSLASLFPLFLALGASALAAPLDLRLASDEAILTATLDSSGQCRPSTDLLNDLFNFVKVGEGCSNELSLAFVNSALNCVKKTPVALRHLAVVDHAVCETLESTYSDIAQAIVGVTKGTILPYQHRSKGDFVRQLLTCCNPKMAISPGAVMDNTVGRPNTSNGGPGDNNNPSPPTSPQVNMGHENSNHPVAAPARGPVSNGGSPPKAIGSDSNNDDTSSAPTINTILEASMFERLSGVNHGANESPRNQVHVPVSSDNGNSNSPSALALTISNTDDMAPALAMIDSQRMPGLAFSSTDNAVLGNVNTNSVSRILANNGSGNNDCDCGAGINEGSRTGLLDGVLAGVHTDVEETEKSSRH